MSAASRRPSFIPSLAYKDNRAALTWLRDAFGFEPSEVLTDAEGDIVHAEMTHGDGVIVMIRHRMGGLDPQPRSRRRQEHPACRMSASDRGIDEHCALSRQAGAQDREGAGGPVLRRTHLYRGRSRGPLLDVLATRSAPSPTKRWRRPPASSSNLCGERSCPRPHAGRPRRSAPPAVVDLLRERPYRAGDLAQAARSPFPTMSRHLQTLRQSGLVEEDRDALDFHVRIYRLKAEAMAELRTWLAETDAMWARQLAPSRRICRRAGNDFEEFFSPFACRPTRREAFDAFTGDIGAWRCPDPLFQITPHGDVRSFEPGPAGRLVTALGNGGTFRDRPHPGLGARQAPRLRLAPGDFSPGQSTEVEVRFEQVGDETRVSIEHRAWDTIPQEHAARHGFPSPSPCTRRRLVACLDGGSQAAACRVERGKRSRRGHTGLRSRAHPGRRQRPSSRLDLTAIHTKRGAGHPFRAGRNEECHQLRDFLGLAVARDAGLLREIFPSPLPSSCRAAAPMLEVGPAASGHDRTGQDAVDLHAVADAAVRRNAFPNATIAALMVPTAA